MPFDGSSALQSEDLVRLRVALDGVRQRWRCGALGVAGGEHCALGWLLVATDYDTAEATRLALDYVYPALPPSAQHEERIESIYSYNDSRGRRAVAKLFEDAVHLAEERVLAVR